MRHSRSNFSLQLLQRKISAGVFPKKISNKRKKSILRWIFIIEIFSSETKSDWKIILGCLFKQSQIERIILFENYKIKRKATQTVGLRHR